MIKALVLALTLTIAGCSQYRTLVGEEGRKASDAAQAGRPLPLADPHHWA
jgi:hypothetical protein